MILASLLLLDAELFTSGERQWFRDFRDDECALATGEDEGWIFLVRSDLVGNDLILIEGETIPAVETGGVYMLTVGFDDATIETSAGGVINDDRHGYVIPIDRDAIREIIRQRPSGFRLTLTYEGNTVFEQNLTGNALAFQSLNVCLATLNVNQRLQEAE